MEITLPFSISSRHHYVASLPKGSKKDRPYLSAKDLKREEVPLNCKVDSPRGKGKIECRHLAMMYLHRFMGKKAKKNVTRDLRNAPAVQAAFSEVETATGLDMESYYEQTLTNPWKKLTRYDAGDLGSYLVAKCDRLRPGGKAGLLLETEHHVMAVSIEYKATQEEVPAHFVFHFYDPNHTDRAVRLERTPARIEGLDSYCLADYLRNEKELEKYLGKNPYLTLIDFDHDADASDSMLPPAYAAADLDPGLVRSLSECDRGNDILLAVQPALEIVLQGDAVGPQSLALPSVGKGETFTVNDIVGGVPVMEPMRLEKVLEALTDPDADGMPALFIAAEKGHTHAVEALCELAGNLVDRLTAAQLSGLLAGKNANRTSALFIAMQEGRTDTVKALCGLLVRLADKLTPPQLLDLLAGKRKDGLPALFQAVGRHKTAAVAALCDAIGNLAGRLETAQLVELIAAKYNRGTTALCMALHLGQTDTAARLCQLTMDVADKLTPPQWLDLMTGKCDDGTMPLHPATYGGKPGAVQAQCALIEHLAGISTQQQFVDVITAGMPDGETGLRSAIAKADPQTAGQWQAMIGRLVDGKKLPESFLPDK